MRAEMEVLHPGLFSTVQDMGRTSALQYGVPRSGVMDQYAAKTANLLLQNAANAAVLEITQMGPRLKFHSRARIAITGAYLSPAVNGEPIKNYEPVHVLEGDELSFGKRKRGCRAYLSVSGGFLSEEVLGSRSWYEGITEVSKLQKNMRLSFGAMNDSEAWGFAALKPQLSYLETEDLPVFRGPEYELLDREQQKLLQTSSFSVSKNNNRMAIQLEEKFSNRLSPIITGPVLPGTIQLTPSGTLIILMRDCQTTGGYPRILQVSEQGLDILAQKVLGDRINFNVRTYGEE